jgi:hypothetical protein
MRRFMNRYGLFPTYGKAADTLCKLSAEHRKPHKINSSYQSLAKAMSKRNSLA